jgi:hypothetical protein
VINLIWKHLLSTNWKFQSFGRWERCFHWNQNGKWQIVVIWEHFGAIFVYISSITCAPCKTSSDWIRVLVAVTNEILKMYSRSAKDGEKGDPNRNPWLAKMGVNVHETKSQLIHGKQSNGTTLLLLFFILRSPWCLQQWNLSHTS